jgi:hypothetical protein
VIEAISRVRSRFTSAQLSRLASIPLAAGTGTVLGIARWLEPSATGHGTHLQLGLRPCTFLTLTGYPCPMCGATTTFALLAHFRVIDAISNQPFAALLAVLTLAIFGISAAEILLPRDRWTRLLAWIEPSEGSLAVGFLLAMGAGWLYKIWLMAG